MLPYLYEFHWSLGHLVFLGVFASVAVTIATCVALAAARAAGGPRHSPPEPERSGARTSS